MADAAEEVVLHLAQVPQLAVLVLDLAEQLGVPDGDPDLAGVQVQERLVGPLPIARRRQAGEDEAHPLVAGAELGPDRHRHARDALLGLHRVGVDEEDHGCDEPECRLGIAGGALGHRLDAVPRLGRFDRRQDRPELSVATLGVGGQAVVALGQLGEDIGPHDRDRLAHVARRDARHRGRDLAQRPDQVQPDRGPAQDPDDDGDGEHEQQEARPDVGIDRAGRR